MEEDTNGKNNKKEYRLNLSNIIAIIVVTAIISVALALATMYIYQCNEETEELELDSYAALDELLNAEVLEPVNETENETEVKTETENETVDETEVKTETEYNYSDYTNNTIPTEILSSDDEEYTVDDYQMYTECVIEFLYSLNSNPFYEVTSSFMNGYEAIKSVGAKGQDGSYVINMNFEDLAWNISCESLNPSTLKTIDMLKNNITVLSENQISVKDTGVLNYYIANFLSFEKDSENEYKGYVVLEEYDEEDNISYKYLNVTVTLKNYYNYGLLVDSLTYDEISKEEIPSDLLEGYDEDEDVLYDYDDYNDSSSNN